MLTRIEIDGFKTFEDFGLDLGPFVVILGPNASGKSNLFDAIRLLSHLAGTDLRTAVKTLRGEPQELFRKKADGSSVTRMAFAVELLLAPEVQDPWGDTVKISHSRVRYEVEIERRKDDRGIERLVVAKEEAKPILAQSDKWQPKKQELSAQFRQLFMKYGRRTPWLTTGESDGKRSFKINQDGRKGRTRPAEAAEATVLSSITSAEFPHLYALREEMRSWRFLQLDPNALRRPSPTTAALELEPDGANLATVLARIQAETATQTRPKGDLADIAADLTSLIPGVVGVSIEEDEKNREYRIDIDMRDGHPFSSRVVSDGTLRVLALLTLLHDPKHRGLVCFEEPENGVHPFRLKAMIERLRELVTDPTSEEVDEQEPLSQMLLNSHSPVVLSCLEKDEAMFADMVSVVNPEVDKISRKTRIRPVKLQGELLPKENREYVGRVEVERYLHSADQEG
jgi:predicted ATPase